jgi:GTP pyrophosphokinase
MKEFIHIYKHLLTSYPQLLKKEDKEKLKKLAPHLDRNTLTEKLHIIHIVLKEIGLGRTSVISILLSNEVAQHNLSEDTIANTFDTAIATVIHGLKRVEGLYKRNTSMETENFRKLLLSFAEDVRVILIMLAERLHTMRHLEEYEEEQRQSIARETAYLYAPLAHRLGLYGVKTELEDLSLKYTNREIYKEIAAKLNATKQNRDAYISAFIKPLKEKLEAAGFQFEMKGRTKSIHSIYNKMKKQNTAFEGIYDLFAIRIILDSKPEKEKAECWQVYSIVADMYQPNPKRLRDWLTIPKSNGYESLHTTVLGPENKWVEVQIRTSRMDEIAEKGLAAHWRYKGIKSESGMDEFLRNIREILENPELNAVNFMDEFKLNLYDKEVFVFTPNGDLHKLPKGATALDFAFAIHTNLGTKCVGARVNGRNMPIKYVLQNGDQVEIMTMPTQKPNAAWLQIVTTTKARNKIRQALKEIEYKDAENGREILLRRLKNWKIEPEEGYISRLAKKQGYKTISDFYQDIAQNKIELLAIKDAYLDLQRRENMTEAEHHSAEEFVNVITDTHDINKADTLIIDKDLKGLDYTLARCCNPIYGDAIFGFVSVNGGIKIHRCDCPNAPQMIERFGYRIVKARWSGKVVGTQYPITLHVVGNDDIGIVTNITSVINKEKNITLRAISIDSNDGLFQGHLTVLVNDTRELEALIKKIKTVKGVKNVGRM